MDPFTVLPENLNHSSRNAPTSRWLYWNSYGGTGRVALPTATGTEVALLGGISIAVAPMGL